MGIRDALDLWSAQAPWSVFNDMDKIVNQFLQPQVGVLPPQVGVLQPQVAGDSASRSLALIRHAKSRNAKIIILSASIFRESRKKTSKSKPSIIN